MTIRPLAFGRGLCACPARSVCRLGLPPLLCRAFAGLIRSRRGCLPLSGLPFPGWFGLEGPRARVPPRFSLLAPRSLCVAVSFASPGGPRPPVVVGVVVSFVLSPFGAGPTPPRWEMWIVDEDREIGELSRHHARTVGNVGICEGSRKYVASSRPIHCQLVRLALTTHQSSSNNVSKLSL